MNYGIDGQSTLYTHVIDLELTENWFFTHFLQLTVTTSEKLSVNDFIIFYLNSDDGILDLDSTSLISVISPFLPTHSIHGCDGSISKLDICWLTVCSSTGYSCFH